MAGVFSPAFACVNIERVWRAWAKRVGARRFVLGVSGGKDSTVVAYLASRIFGPENVVGVMMPNGDQADIDDSREVVALTGIRGVECNVGGAFDAISSEVRRGLNDFGENARVNLPPRLRMATLYAVAQTWGAFVLNTDNLSERVCGYFTMWGDGAGDFAPLRGLTATEVVSLGEWMGVPDRLIHKKPGDGLQAQGDEERLGFTYAVLDDFIRGGSCTPETESRIMERFERNRFKVQAVSVAGPKFGFMKRRREFALPC